MKTKFEVAYSWIMITALFQNNPNSDGIWKGYKGKLKTMQNSLKKMQLYSVAFPMQCL